MEDRVKEGKSIDSVGYKTSTVFMQGVKASLRSFKSIVLKTDFSLGGLSGIDIPWILIT